MTTASAEASGSFAPTAESTSPGEDGENEEGDIALIVGLSIAAVALIIVIVIFGIWYYRRRTGHWPKPFRRHSSPAISRNPYGSKSYANRWRRESLESNPPQINTHRADFRDPTPPIKNKQVNTITEKISSHLREASEKVDRQQQQTNNLKITSPSSAAGHPSSNPETAAQEPNNSKAALRKPTRGRYNEIGKYQDRTLPTTLMMSSESKRQMFLKEENALKRSNSATLRSSSQRKSSTVSDKDKPPYSAHMQKYNDFGPNSNIGKYGNKRKNRNTSNLSSYLSSKPSNTSDYVSDVDTSTDEKKWKRRHNVAQLRRRKPQKRISDCDSMLQDSSVIGNKDILEIYEQELEQALHVGEDNLTVSSRLDNKRRRKTKPKSHVKSNPNSCYDDRTESQQNTMKSEVFYNYGHQISEENEDEGGSIFEGQSSDTESMVDSTLSNEKDLSSFRLKRRQSNSDGISQILNGSKKGRNKTRKRIKRTRSDGWDSEPGQDSMRRKQNRSSRRRKNFQSTEDVFRESSKPGSIIASPIKSSIPKINIEDLAYEQSPYESSIPSSINSSSLKEPIGGTILEMPIYSQSTWSGPGSRSKSCYSNHSSRKPLSEKRANRHNKRKDRKNGRTGRTLSIGGGGRYFCEYGSLPVDLSKLPKDLIAKIGGQADQLLEPIEQLNFDHLCRPLPNLGQTEGELSARRLISEKLCLPPGHRDRELLSNTYEYEDTGMVTTDL